MGIEISTMSHIHIDGPSCAIGVFLVAACNVGHLIFLLISLVEVQSATNNRVLVPCFLSQFGNASTTNLSNTSECEH